MWNSLTKITPSLCLCLVVLFTFHLLTIVNLFSLFCLLYLQLAKVFPLVQRNSMVPDAHSVVFIERAMYNTTLCCSKRCNLVEIDQVRKIALSKFKQNHRVPNLRHYYPMTGKVCAEVGHSICSLGSLSVAESCSRILQQDSFFLHRLFCTETPTSVISYI